MRLTVNGLGDGLHHRPTLLTPHFTGVTGSHLGVLTALPIEARMAGP